MHIYILIYWCKGHSSCLQEAHGVVEWASGAEVSEAEQEESPRLGVQTLFRDWLHHLLLCDRGQVI